MTFISIVIPYIVQADELIVYVQKRMEDGHLDGLYEFPGGKIEIGETPYDAAKREYLEEVGHNLEEAGLKLFSNFSYSYEDRDLQFYIFCFDVSMNRMAVNGLAEQKIPWESAQNIVQEADIPEANKVFLLQFIEFALKQWRES